MDYLTPDALYDPEYLKKLQVAASALSNSPDDNSKAGWNGLLQMGLALMGARKGREAEAFGNAGLMGLQARDQYLNQQTVRRGADINQALNLQTLQQHQMAQKAAQASAAEQQSIWGPLGSPRQVQGPQLQNMGPGGPTPDNAARVVPPVVSAPPGSGVGDIVAKLRLSAQAYLRGGDQKSATNLLEAANKMEASGEFSGQPQTYMFDGKPVLVGMNKRGEMKNFTKDSGYAPKPEFDTVNLGGTTQLVNKLTVPPEGQAFEHTPTPGELLVDKRAATANWLKQQELQGADQSLTPDALTNAAFRYNFDGTLPPMGMGKQAALNRNSILNAAADQAKASGLEPGDQRWIQLSRKSEVASLTKLSQQETMVGAFEKTFNKNVDIVQEYSAKVDRTGVPLANKWIQVGKRAIAGDPQLSAYDFAIKSAVNEYAKIISGSMGNTAMAESEVKKIESMLNAAQTPQQVDEVVAFMKRETGNRMSGFSEQRKEINDRIKGGSKLAEAASLQPNQVKTPDGAIQTFSTKQQADAFKKAHNL